MCVSSPAPAMHRSIGRLGASACVIVLHPAQASFLRRRYASSTFILSMVNCAIFKASCERRTSPRNAALLVTSSANVMVMTLPATTTARDGTCPVNRLLARLHRHAWLPRAFRVPPVDPFQQHRELRGAQRDAPGFGLRPNKSAPLKTLRQHAHAVAVTPQQLHQVASAAAEREDVATERILRQRHLNLRCQRVDAAAHVRHASGKPHPGPCARADHALWRSARKTVPNSASSTAPRSRNRAPAISTSMTPERAPRLTA